MKTYRIAVEHETFYTVEANDGEEAIDNIIIHGRGKEYCKSIYAVYSLDSDNIRRVNACIPTASPLFGDDVSYQVPDWSEVNQAEVWSQVRQAKEAGNAILRCGVCSQWIKGSHECNGVDDVVRLRGAKREKAKRLS